MTYRVEYLRDSEWILAAQFLQETAAQAYADNMKRFLKDVRIVMKGKDE